MLHLFSDNKSININPVEFSDGAITYKLEGLPENPRYLCITVNPKTPVYRIREELSILLDSLMLEGSVYNAQLYLHMAYLPYGRADRQFEKGNPEPLSNFLSWLSSVGKGIINNIMVCDIHNISAVEGKLGGINLIQKTQLECFKDSLPLNFNGKYDIVLAPDKGSVDKAATIAEYLKLPVYNCEKERDISTGKILRSTLPEGVEIKGKKVLIPDDIFDGGYTFIKLAEQLKEMGAEQVDLYITHLIAAKGLGGLKGLVDNIYYHHVIGNYIDRKEVWEYNESN